jgi:hypothetical protein
VAAIECPSPFALQADGDCALVLPSTIVDKHGHLLDGDHDPKAKDGCDHRDTVEWKREHRNKGRKEHHMAEQQQEQSVVAQTQPTATKAEVGMPPAFDLSKVIPADGAISPMAATLGALAILSGVALKVVPSWLKSQAEMATKRLELKAKRMELEHQSKRDEKGGDCASRHAAALAALSAIEERLGSLEAKADGLAHEVESVKHSASSLSFDGDDGDIDRLEALEKKIAALAARVGA